METLNLDNEWDSVQSLSHVEDLSKVTSVLEVTFITPKLYSFSASNTLRCRGISWEVLSIRSTVTSIGFQNTAYCIPSGITQKVSKVPLLSSDIASIVGMSSPDNRFSVIKFKTPMRGDNVAVIMRALRFQSYEENASDPTKAICLYYDGKALISNTWEGLLRGTSVKYTQEGGLITPVYSYIKDIAMGQFFQTALPETWTQASYWNWVFGARMEVRSNSQAVVGKVYSFNTGVQSIDNTAGKMLCIGQKFSLHAEDNLPYTQVFAKFE